MPWELTVTDLQTGGGASVSVGAATGDEWIVQRATVTSAGVGAYATVVGPLTGSGTTGVTGVDYYMWRLVDNVTSDILAGPTFQPTTTGGDSIWNRAVVVVKDRIKDEVLPTIGTTNVHDKLLANLYVLTLPCIVVTPTGTTLRENGGTNERDDIGYPMDVMLIEKVADDVEAVRNRFLYWTERCHDLLRNQNWEDARLPEAHLFTTEPASALATGTLREDRVRLGIMGVVAWARRGRG